MDQINLHEALSHVFELLFIDKDSVSLLCIDKKNGFVLDISEDAFETSGSEVYELAIWGDEWVNAINMC